MKLYAIRHTSVAVDSGICYGQSDVDVADSFLEEMKKTSMEIANLSFDKVYSSTLKRCRELAEGLFCNQEIEFDARLKELNFGDWELKTWDDIYSEPKGKVWMDNYQELPTLNGESYPEMVNRVSSFLSELKKENVSSVVIVAHAGVIRIFKSLIENVPISELFESFKPAYGSVNEFEL